MKSHYEGGELDRDETIARLVEDVENWDIDRLRCYAKECVERDLKAMTSDDLVDQWMSEMDSTQIPTYSYAQDDSEYGVSIYEMNRPEQRRAS